MAKQFLTAQDIELYCAEDVKELPINNDVVITDLARERARELGVRILPDPTAAALVPPERAETDRQFPYSTSSPTSASTRANLTSRSAGNTGAQVSQGELKTAVLAALRHEGVEPPRNLDEIIKRVLEA